MSSAALANISWPKDEQEHRIARKALFAYAHECQKHTKGWHGELLGTDNLIERFCITAEELNIWRKSGQLICFGRSRRKRRYPAEQFTSDGRIVPGIGEVLRIVGTPGAAWLWLRGNWGPLGNQRPLDLLKAGDLERVLAAAHRQYDLDAGW